MTGHLQAVPPSKDLINNRGEVGQRTACRSNSLRTGHEVFGASESCVEEIPKIAVVGGLD